MATYSLSPLFNGWQGFGVTGLPLNAGQLFTYQAGTTTPQATYTTSSGAVPNGNPIILGADGRPPQEIWLEDGLSYKFVLMDSLSNLIDTYDNIQSVGTLIQNFISSTTFLTAADGRYPLYAGTAGGSSDAITATLSTSITALYDGMIVSVDAIAGNTTTTPTFTLTLGSAVTATLTIVDYNLQPLLSGAIAGVGHKILLGYNATQAKWVLINPQPTVAASGTTSRRQTTLIGPVDISGMPAFLPQTVTGLTLTTKNIDPLETAITSTVTFTNGSAIIGWVGHTLVDNQAVSFTTTGGLPTGFSVGTTYYVSSTGLSANQFEVAATPGGTPIVAASAGTGTQTGWAGFKMRLTATAYYGNDGPAGELNVVGQATTNFSFPALADNTTNYLYSVISPLGAFSHFSTTLAPIIVYGSTTEPSATSGQITIDVVRGEVYLGNGSAAVETYLVVWGTATTLTGNITNTLTYNYGKPPSFAGKKSDSLLRRTVYNTAGNFSWIKSPLTSAINVKVKGGGGAGGPSSNPLALSWASSGGGGGEGGYAEAYIDAISLYLQTVTLASAGSSSFGALVSATAGATGSTGTSGAGAIAGVSGGVGGTGTGGDINLTGQQGGSTWATAVTLANNSMPPGGQGGGLGGGEGAPGGIAAAGISGTAGINGGGGGGASAGTSIAAGSGGAGSVGYVIVEEYL